MSLLALALLAALCGPALGQDLPTEAAPITVGNPDVPSARPGPPTAENCTGVTCDIEAIRNCPSPVLLAKRCCPTCPELDACNGVVCDEAEICTVHDGQAICCSELTAVKAKKAKKAKRKPKNKRGRQEGGEASTPGGRGARKGRSVVEGADATEAPTRRTNSGRRATGRAAARKKAAAAKKRKAAAAKKKKAAAAKKKKAAAAKKKKAAAAKKKKAAAAKKKAAKKLKKKRINVASVLNRARCRYSLENNCSLRFISPLEGSGPCADNQCTTTEKCVAATMRQGRRRVAANTSKCCAIHRLECPRVPKPTVLGKCHLPGEPVPEIDGECTCGNILTVTKMPRLGAKDSPMGKLGTVLRSTFQSVRQSSGVCRRHIVRITMVDGERQLQRCKCKCDPVVAIGRLPRNSQCRRMKEVEKNQCRVPEPVPGTA